MHACPPQKYTLPGCDARQAERTPPRQPPPLLLAPVGDKTVALAFDGGRLSAAAGLVLLQESEDPRGLTRALAAVLADARAVRRLHFTPEDRLTQRILHMAAGYAEANDAHTLRHAPLVTLLLDRLPATGAPWASQPTLSRGAHSVSRPAMYRLALVLGEQCMASYTRPPEVIVRDVDDTEDRAHGAQAQSRYAGYDGGYGCMPCHLYEGLSGPLITTILQAKRFSGAHLLAVLTRVGKRLRPAWPATWCICRGDRHLAYPEVMAWSEAPASLSYGIGLTRHAV